MNTLTPEQRDALLAEIQKIPDGATVKVVARPLLTPNNADTFATIGPIYTTENGARYVGDTHLSFWDAGRWYASSRITSVRVWS
jgi:hypothetical protein